ncbi:MAG: hypothetical protein ASARMPREDX12_001192 [Alectoria sarmentosa]|nr:MAG: hypothetical protein ASARMPREDX12_001192 [Alectoria sarmentosa]
MTIDPTNASRSSSESSFLQHTCNKTTLEVHNNTLAQKLVFADKKVKAVIVASGGASASENLSYILSARKEVIVSAGAVYLNSVFGPLSVADTKVLGFEKLPPMFRNRLSFTTQKELNDMFPADWPDLEFLPISGVLGNQTDYQTSDPKDGYNYATVATALIAPLSRGNVSIDTTKMSDPPLLNPNWLTHPGDVKLAIAAFKRQRKCGIT